MAMKVDGDTEYGGKFKTRFDVSKYPTTLFFNAQGEMVHKLIGAGSLDGFMKLLLAHLENRLTMDGVQAPQIAGEAELRTWIGAATERPDDKRPDLTAALEADDPNIASFARWAEAHWGEGWHRRRRGKNNSSNSQRRTEILRFNPSQPSVLLNNGRRVGRGKRESLCLKKNSGRRTGIPRYCRSADCSPAEPGSDPGSAQPSGPRGGRSCGGARWTVGPGLPLPCGALCSEEPGGRCTQTRFPCVALISRTSMVPRAKHPHPRWIKPVALYSRSPACLRRACSRFFA